MYDLTRRFAGVSVFLVVATVVLPLVPITGQREQYVSHADFREQVARIEALSDRLAKQEGKTDVILSGLTRVEDALTKLLWGMFGLAAAGGLAKGGVKAFLPSKKEN